MSRDRKPNEPDCPVCKAKGKIDHPRLPFRTKLCPKCGGRGRIIPQPHYRKR
jgi:DnaJ-class molecular chaperone